MANLLLTALPFFVTFVIANWPDKAAQPVQARATRRNQLCRGF